MSNRLNDDFSDLDELFTLPEEIELESGLRTAYEVIVMRMRAEARGIPMTTVQQLLIERIAYNYVIMRHHERQNEFRTTTAQKEFNNFWLSMTHEFNSLVKVTDSEYREQLLQHVGKVITDALTEDYPEVAGPIRQRLSEEFAVQGL